MTALATVDGFSGLIDALQKVGGTATALAICLFFVWKWLLPFIQRELDSSRQSREKAWQYVADSQKEQMAEITRAVQALSHSVQALAASTTQIQHEVVVVAQWQMRATDALTALLNHFGVRDGEARHTGRLAGNNLDR